MTSIALIRASDGSGNASMATIQNVRSPGSAAIIVDTVVGIGADFMGSMGTPHTFVDPITSETITVISEDTCVDFAGHVNGSNLEIDTIAPGYSDSGSAVGDIVIIRSTTQWADNIADTLAVAHNDDGSLKTASVTAVKMVNGGVFTGDAASTFPALTIGAAAIGTSKIADGAITAPKLDAAAIYLGSTVITSNFNTSSASPVQITGFTVTVTIPAGSRKTKITVIIPAITSTVTATMAVSLWDGTVGSGTQIGQMNVSNPTGSYNGGISLTVLVNPSAGSKTYNVGILTGAGSITATGSSVAPALLLVEAL